jgi:uncharacterized oxidoreductase
MKMTDNTILITGGGSGLGRGLAEAFHKLGNQVIISGRRQRKLDEVTGANPGMKALTVDMTNADSIRSLAAQVSQDHPRLNVLINMAGVMMPENLLDQKEPLSDAEATIATNLLGPIRLTAALLPTLTKQPRAVIMNVSSGLAFLPLAMTPTYCATKAAIHSYTQSLRYQLKETPIQVLELIPPYVQTELMGAHQTSDPRAMPLDDFITESMDILTAQPDATEILVKNVYPLRFAAENGQEKYEQQLKGFNDAMTANAGH